MHEMNNIKKWLIKTGEWLLPVLTWVCFRTAVRIIFGLKREEMGGKRCIMLSSIIYTACEMLGL